MYRRKNGLYLARIHLPAHQNRMKGLMPSRLRRVRWRSCSFSHFFVFTAIIVVVLAMVWFGTGSMVPVFVVAVLMFPGTYLNTADGWRSIDTAKVLAWTLVSIFII